MYANTNNDDKLINAAITLEEDERTSRAKKDFTNVCRVTIDAAHTAIDKIKTTILQRVRNVRNAVITETRRLINSITLDVKQVQFRRRPAIATFYNDNAKMLT